jgi:hypothetical protein
MQFSVDASPALDVMIRSWTGLSCYTERQLLQVILKALWTRKVTS